MAILTLTKNGLYCPQGDFYIDPWRKVNRAVITHAHGDHARWGNKYYLSQEYTVPILKARLGEGHYEGIEYGETCYINNVKISFHPAGHIIGSAQVRLEYQGEVVVVSGDYKLENDGLSTPFESVKCDTFITESTFGLPVYQWPTQESVFNDIHKWWQRNQEKGVTSVISAYSLGKAQRLLHHLDSEIGPIYVHGAIYNINEALATAGLAVKSYPKIELSSKKTTYKNAMIIAPPSAIGSHWMRRFQPYSVGTASGWMAVRGIKRRQAVDKGFVLSDHADWAGLNEAVEASGATKVLATHGYSQQFSAWLRFKGLEAGVLETEFAAGGDESELDIIQDATEEGGLES